MQNQRGVAYQLSTEGLWTLEARVSRESGGPGRRGAGSWWRRAEDQQAPEGPVFLKNQVSEESYC